MGQETRRVWDSDMQIPPKYDETWRLGEVIPSCFANSHPRDGGAAASTGAIADGQSLFLYSNFQGKTSYQNISPSPRGQRILIKMFSFCVFIFWFVDAVSIYYRYVQLLPLLTVRSYHFSANSIPVISSKILARGCDIPCKLQTTVRLTALPCKLLMSR